MNPIMRIEGRSVDLGEGMLIRRILPHRQQRMIGAWCFLDHAGPIQFEAGKGMHVGAHPHIGLQTFTWLLKGEVLHRDSLGNEQITRPGQVNLMTAGKGIVHTEDSLPNQQVLHAAQLWIALPEQDKEIEPAFDHHPLLPTWEKDGLEFTLLAGEYGALKAPPKMYSPMIGMDIYAPVGGSTTLDLNPEFEYGFMALEGGVSCGAEHFPVDELAYISAGNSQITLKLAKDSRVLFLGGTPFKEPVLIWWNFVGHSKEEIAQAARAWGAKSDRFGFVTSVDERRLVMPNLPWVGV